MAEITFLAPGSCQLEVTAQGNVGTDTGVDLASVSWTIEQALIAGCRFSPSAGDVHIDRNGVLTIGRSLFDRINQADGDENIPGQCTLIIRADSTITENVLDRFKVLVGYPGEGGGGGGAQTVDVNIWNVTNNESLKAALPSEVQYVTGYEQGTTTYSDPLSFEHVTSESNGTTLHGVRVSGLPVGAAVAFTFDTEVTALDYLEFALTESGAAGERPVALSKNVVPAPVGGLVIVGGYGVTAAG